MELGSAEFVFPITVEQNGQEFVALFHMTAYKPRDLDEALRLTGFRTKQNKGWFRSEAVPLAPMIDFFDRHFIRMSGVAGDHNGLPGERASGFESELGQLP